MTTLEITLAVLLAEEDLEFPLLVELSVDGITTMVRTIYGSDKQDIWHPGLVPENPQSLPRLLVSDKNGKTLEFEVLNEVARRIYHVESEAK